MMRQALTIAGSDSGAGAGIQADLKTFHANGVYGLSVITAITAQNTRALLSRFELPLDAIKDQLTAVFSDFKVSAVKTGMLSSAAVVGSVADFLSNQKVSCLVVDPVMISKTGATLLYPEGIDVMKTSLVPLATVVTPNIYEAEILAEMKIGTLSDVKQAAHKISSHGAKNVLIKGGHLDGPMAIDVLYDGKDYTCFESERITSKNVHGTGCTLSAAIAAQLALGKNLIDAVGSAKRYTTEVIKHGLNIGHGNGPMDHFYRWRRETS